MKINKQICIGLVEVRKMPTVKCPICGCIINENYLNKHQKTKKCEKLKDIHKANAEAEALARGSMRDTSLEKQTQNN